jgi:hypothetical protein
VLHSPVVGRRRSADGAAEAAEPERV